VKICRPNNAKIVDRNTKNSLLVTMKDIWLNDP